MAILGAPASGYSIATAWRRLTLGVAGLSGSRRLLAAAAAGLTAAASLPPLDLWPALFAGVAVLLWLLDGVRLQHGTVGWRIAAAFATGWSFGFGYFAVSLYWVGFAFLVDAETFAALMPLAVSALPAGLALFWGLAAAAAMAFWHASGLGRAVVLAIALAIAEWLRGHVLTGFPWNALGYAAGGLDGLAQGAAVVGLYGMTFLVLLWAGVAAAMVTERLPWRSAVAAAAILALAPVAWAAGAWRLANAETATVEGLQLRIVQANIPQSEKWRAERRDGIIEEYVSLSAAGGLDGITHIIWPESAVPVLIDEQPELRDRLARLLPSSGMLILGALRREPGEPSRSKVFNSVLAMNGTGEIVARYDKWRLVPFGEYLPLAALLEPLGLRKLVTLPLGFSAGAGPATLAIEGTPAFAPLVCYEVIFPHSLIDRQARPDWLLNVTNDGWFGATAGPYQHLAQARFRAIEEGLPLVRAANTGISAVIDPYGRILHRLGLGEPGTIDSPLPRPLPPTVYGRFGDGLFFAMLALAALVGRVFRDH